MTKGSTKLSHALLFIYLLILLRRILIFALRTSVQHTCHCRRIAQRRRQDSLLLWVCHQGTWAEPGSCWDMHMSGTWKTTSLVSHTSSEAHFHHSSVIQSAPGFKQIQWPFKLRRWTTRVKQNRSTTLKLFSLYVRFTIAAFTSQPYL